MHVIYTVPDKAFISVDGWSGYVCKSPNSAIHSWWHGHGGSVPENMDVKEDIKINLMGKTDLRR